MLPTYHDEQLTELAAGEGTATLSIRRGDGVVWRIELAGVRHLRADDFREGNIIYPVEATTGSTPSRQLVEMLVTGPHQTAAQTYHDEHRAHIDGLTDQVESGCLTLISVTPSYGCEVLALCETFVGTQVR